MTVSQSVSQSDINTARQLQYVRQRRWLVGPIISLSEPELSRRRRVMSSWPTSSAQSGPSSAYRPSHTKSHCKIAGSNLAEEKYHKSVPKWDGSAFKTKPQIISRTAKKIVNQPERERVDKTVDKTPRVAVTPPAPPETWLLYSPRVGNRTKSLLSVFVWSRDADYAGIQARQLQHSASPALQHNDNISSVRKISSYNAHISLFTISPMSKLAITRVGMSPCK